MWFAERDSESITVNEGEQKRRYLIRKVFPFTSERKCMSVVVECDGKLVAYVKGADTAFKKMVPDVNQA